MIRFAQWVRVSGSRSDQKEFVFLSNYDGDWDSYLEDFLTKVPGGLTVIWSNTTRYPRTKFLHETGRQMPIASSEGPGVSSTPLCSGPPTLPN